MSIDADIVSYAKSDPAIHRLAGDRVSFNILSPEDALPAVTIEKMGDEPARHMGGRSRHVRHEFRLSCWGNSRVEASELRSAVLQAFDERSGAIGGSLVARMYAENASDQPEGPLPGQDAIVPCVVVNLEVIETVTAAIAV